MTSVQIFNWIKEQGAALAQEEGLKLQRIERNDGKVKHNQRAHCTADGIIRVKLRMSTTLLDRTKIQETARDICHELAHLKHFHHGPEFWQYQAELCKKMSEKLGTPIPPERSIV